MYGVDTCTYSDGLPRNVLNRYRFDTVLTNPNYNKGSDLKMLRNLMGNGTIELPLPESLWSFILGHGF